jgi:aldehyde:ferredoxin oxidoreductase
VTAEEYESRADRYDGQLRDELGLNPEQMSLDEKRLALRQHREQRYQQLLDAVYQRRGWTQDGIPTLAKLKELGIDWVDGVVDTVRAAGVNE